ncbi:MAG: hypothetical protein LBD75_06595 [Candidatus Peribacteria bacterium]|jgi:hypothetical protein|nr:hypothetical protein [Candidatus Peribacteria bacterium]
MTYGAGKDIIKQLEDLSKTEEGREQLKRYIKAKYGSKIAFQDVEHLDQILKGIGSLNEMEVTYPYFIGKILYRKLFKGKITQKSMVESDIRNLID